ncbi:MAG: hypothetical protein P9L99_19625 [Candidatus Lernaella stagnicola]|nr:hypothetical protein [Candidatus Lernaella stagnicola]
MFFKMSRTALILILVLSFTAVTALAQDDPTATKKPFEWRFFFGLGGGHTMLSELNADMDDAGYNEFPGGFGAGSFGFIGNYNRWMFGTHGISFSLAPIEDKAENWTAAAEGSFGVAQFGYAVLHQGGWQLYPLIGLGLGNATLRIYDDTDTDFDEVLRDPRRMSSIKTGFFLVNAEFGFDYRFNMVQNTHGDRSQGLVLGGRLGYAYTPINRDWSMGDTQVDDAPLLGINGPYLQFVIGWGGGGVY